VIGRERRIDVETELKPCPFCGDLPDIERYWRSDVVRCSNINCSMHAAGFMYPDTWNTRPIEDAVRSDNARLTAELDAAKAELGISIETGRGLMEERDEARTELFTANERIGTLRELDIENEEIIRLYRNQLAVCHNKLERIKAQGIFIRDRSSTSHHLTDAGKAIIGIVDEGR
jgi:hypothetical protein